MDARGAELEEQTPHHVAMLNPTLLPRPLRRPRPDSLLRLAQASGGHSAIFTLLDHEVFPVNVPSLSRLSLSAGVVAATGFFALLLTLGSPPVAAQESSAEAIQGWIGQLGAEQFAERESASRSLAAAGPAALGPLAEAARGGDLEVASRAIDVIRGYLDPPAAEGEGVRHGEETGEQPAADAAVEPSLETSSRDVALALEAERLLETLAEGPPGPVPQIAATALEFHQLGMHEAAQDRLQSLGAKINDNYLSMASGKRGLEAVIDTRWKGSSEDLRLLPRLRNLRHVGIHGLKIDAQTLALLGRLRSLENIQLYGTGVSDEAVAALAARFPNAEIDVRKGGKLGVGGQRIVGPCQITQVVAGSAADRAGLQIGDVVLSMDGVAVKNFEGLTEYVGRHGPGESIEVEIERAVAGKVPQRFTATVTLDGWD
jgi:membrane-associated protease RseP (regulator of RpoE activity)